MSAVNTAELAALSAADVRALVDEFLESHAERIEMAVVRAMDRVGQTTTLPYPRTPEEIGSRWDRWTEKYREAFCPILDEELRRQVPLLARLEGPQVILGAIQREVWPRVQARLREQRLLSLARKYARHHLGDALGVRRIMPDGHRYRADLVLPNADEPVGVLVLDSTGRVLTDESSSREELLEKARVR